jgi:hypothetical protein
MKRVGGYVGVTTTGVRFTVELAYTAEIDGNAYKTITLEVNIQQNQRYHSLSKQIFITG